MSPKPNVVRFGSAACSPTVSRTVEESAPDEKLIVFESVSKSFGEGAITAVQNVSLTVNRGDFVTLVGPSGCGKSTLLNMTAGIYRATEGRVLYRNVEVAGLNLSVGYMTQTDHLLPWRTTFQNVAAPLEIKRVPWADAERRVTELLEAVGLTGFKDQYPGELSGGMRKRAVLARLLAYDAETLLMDEPFGALDAQLRLTLQIELRRMCRALGKTVLFVTHDLDEAIALGDVCVVFSGRPGRIIRQIPVPLPGERNIARLRFDPAYIQTCEELWELLSPAMSGPTKDMHP